MPDWKTFFADPKARIGAVAAAVLVLGLVVWGLSRGPDAPAETSTAAQSAPPPSAATPAATPADAPAPGSTQAGAPAPPPVPPKDTARIVFATVPSTNATVTWGKTRLGVIGPSQSLVIVRPRDSGPLDVVVRAPGYLPVQTRAHTFADTRIVVKLTKPDATQTLIGYKAPIDAGVDAGSSFGSVSDSAGPSPFP